MWPHKFLETAPIDNKTVLAVLTHDEKFDIPLLEIALRSPAAYVGAMGSRATHERRVALLKERGVTDVEFGASALTDRVGSRREDTGGDCSVDPRRDDQDPAQCLRFGTAGSAGPIHPPPQENPTALHRTA